jgi:hypothetical protein
MFASAEQREEREKKERRERIAMQYSPNDRWLWQREEVRRERDGDSKGSRLRLLFRASRDGFEVNACIRIYFRIRTYLRQITA